MIQLSRGHTLVLSFTFLALLVGCTSNDRPEPLSQVNITPPAETPPQNNVNIANPSLIVANNQEVSPGDRLSLVWADEFDEAAVAEARRGAVVEVLVDMALPEELAANIDDEGVIGVEAVGRRFLQDRLDRRVRNARAARRWIAEEYRKISKECGGCLADQSCQEGIHSEGG